MAVDKSLSHVVVASYYSFVALSAALKPPDTASSRLPSFDECGHSSISWAVAVTVLHVRPAPIVRLHKGIVRAMDCGDASQVFTFLDVSILDLAAALSFRVHDVLYKMRVAMLYTASPCPPGTDETNTIPRSSQWGICRDLQHHYSWSI